jgi:hypothetical protein
MEQRVHVTAVEVTGDHRLRLGFEDGAVGEVDFSGWDWRGVFEPLADAGRKRARTSSSSPWRSMISVGVPMTWQPVTTKKRPAS